MNHLDQFAHLPYSHHAYGIESDQDIVAQVKSVIPAGQCSYIFDRHYDSFKIDDARAIKSLQAEKTEKAAVFIISFTVINNEAQNALLKVLEEPTANTYFILIFPNAKKLLPTLQSRLSLVHVDVTEGSETERKLPVSSFITMSLQERFDIIKDLTDKKNNNTLSKSDMLLFLNDLERYLSEQSVKQPDVFDVLFRARSYLNANGASHKMILDMVAMHM